MTEYSPVIGNKKLEDYFSVKNITVLNNRKSERNLYVLADKGDFAQKTFKNDLFEIVFYFATDEIIEKVEGEFKDILKKQQEHLNYLLWDKNYTFTQNKLSIIDNLKLNAIEDKFEEFLKKTKRSQSTDISKTENLIHEAQDAISTTYKAIQKAINKEIAKQHLELIKNLSSKNFDEIIQAVQIYIGNYAFDTLEFICHLLTNYDETFKDIVKQYKMDIKNLFLDELFEGAKERQIFSVTPQGGIRLFMDFIKNHDKTAYNQLNDYIEKTLTLAVKPLTLTPSQLNQLFYIDVNSYNENHVKKEKNHKIVIENNKKNIFYNLPTSTANNMITEILSYKENIHQLPIRKNLINHNSKYEVFKDDNQRRVTLKNDNAEIVIELENIEKIMGAKNPAMKFFVLSLIKANEQALHSGKLERDYVSFPLQELVSIGFYKSIRSARAGFMKGISALTSLKLKGKVKKAKNKEVMINALEVLFTGAKIDRGQCYIYLNNRIDWNFITQYYSLIPKYYFTLSSRGSELLYYIFYLARQNTEDITNKGYFNISFRAIQHRLLLPLENETKNPLRDIKEAIEEAITEIENAHFTDYGKDSKEVEFSLLQLPISKDELSIEEYLNNGYLQVGLKGDFAKKFIGINQDTIKQIETAKKRKNRAIEKAIESQIVKKIENEKK